MSFDIDPMTEIDPIQEAYEHGLKDGQPKWISVKDRLPAHGQIVILFEDKVDNWEMWFGNYSTYSKEFLYCYGNGNKNDREFTHWMPLPQPPKELERSDESEVQGDE